MTNLNAEVFDLQAKVAELQEIVLALASYIPCDRGYPEGVNYCSEGLALARARIATALETGDALCECTACERAFREASRE